MTGFFSTVHKMKGTCVWCCTVQYSKSRERWSQKSNNLERDEVTIKGQKEDRELLTA